MLWGRVLELTVEMPACHNAVPVKVAPASPVWLPVMQTLEAMGTAHGTESLPPRGEIWLCSKCPAPAQPRPQLLQALGEQDSRQSSLLSPLSITNKYIN